jgi:hypothetical protein
VHDDKARAQFEKKITEVIENGPKEKEAANWIKRDQLAKATVTALRDVFVNVVSEVVKRIFFGL